MPKTRKPYPPELIASSWSPARRPSLATIWRDCTSSGRDQSTGTIRPSERDRPGVAEPSPVVWHFAAPSVAIRHALGFSRWHCHYEQSPAAVWSSPSARPASTTTRRAPGGRPVRLLEGASW